MKLKQKMEIKPHNDVILLELPKELKAVIESIDNSTIVVSEDTLNERKQEAVRKFYENSGVFTVHSVGPLVEGIVKGDRIVIDGDPSQVSFYHDGKLEIYFRIKSYQVDAVITGLIEKEVIRKNTTATKSGILLS